MVSKPGNTSARDFEMDKMKHVDNIGYQNDAYMSCMGDDAESKSGRDLKIDKMKHVGDIAYGNDVYAGGLSFKPGLDAREPGSV